MLKITKRDYLFCICTLLVAGCICAFVYGFAAQNAGDSVDIFLRNDKIATLSLDEDRTFEILESGVALTLRIRDGSADVIHSACTGQDCVRTPPISKPGQVILCAKQNVLIQITSQSKPDGVVV